MRYLLALLLLTVSGLAYGAVTCTLLEDVYPSTSIGGTVGHGCHYSNPSGGDFWLFFDSAHDDPARPICPATLTER